MNKIREKQKFNKNLKKNDNNKIIINSPNDLINIPIQQLREIDVSKFSGIIFEKIYQEALKIEGVNEKEDNRTQYSDNSENSKKKYVKIEKLKLNKYTNYEAPIPERETRSKDIDKNFKKETNYKSNKIMKLKFNDDYINKTDIEKKVILNDEEEDDDGSIFIVEDSARYSKRNKGNQNYKEYEDLKKQKYISTNYNETKYTNTDYNDINENANTKNQTKNNKNNNSNKNKKINKNNKYINASRYSNLNNSLEFNRYNNNVSVNSINNAHEKSSNYLKTVSEFMHQRNDSQNITFKKITFQIKHSTEYGEDVGVSGSIPSLGNWNEKKILYLKWIKGNEWIGSINNFENNDFEFKLVVLNEGKIKNWESGPNNKINMNTLLKQIKKQSNGKYGKFNYMFNMNTNELKFLYKWN